jgi:SAM-dependent methyltransferase
VSVVAPSPRAAIGRFLRGDGIEIGPGHNPFPLPPVGTRVRYVDRWQPEENAELFFELQDPDFPRPDVVLNLDTDLLGPFEDESLDFVIASHVLEHMANPIAILDDVHRVLRPGGVAVVLLPDRRRTFDRHRTPTPLDHLVTEYRQGVDEVSDEHIVEFLLSTGTCTAEPGPDFIELYRRRSVHVHCWTEQEWVPVVAWTVGTLGHRWELLDGVSSDANPASEEFGMILAKSGALEPAAQEQRFLYVWNAWHDHELALAADRLPGSPEELPPPSTAELARTLVGRGVGKARRVTSSVFHRR